MTKLRIKEIIAQYVKRPVEELSDDVRLGDDLGLDSLDQTEIILELEQECGVNLEPPGTPSLTIAEVTAWALGAIKENQSAAAQG